MTDAPLAIVRHITRNHIEIRPRPDCSVIVFNIREQREIEAVVSTNDGSETVRLLVAAPAPDQSIAIKNQEDITHILYVEKLRAV